MVLESLHTCRSKNCCWLVCPVLFAACCLVLLGCAGQGGETAPDAIKGSDSIMDGKAHGTCPKAPQTPLRWNADWDTADRICCFNRHYAERSGSWQTTSFPDALASASSSGSPITFYDSVTGKPLFVAPQGRSFADFERESIAHGWPSFRDAEVVQESVRVLPDGETVSVDGTHLGHNLPDSKGNRYCINLVSVRARALDLKTCDSC
eukprot:TRINITY_DN61352_c0_g1_i1.p1 TRINITY_DN61352_c0_g1~~TRINITY_DN61352_c0_g1_i1.p1  ORF type:complete len:227 (-),score=29.51 TRINITY_DN61352_c0_g1_i1:23-643(-)